jgi:hypothetical protein
MKTTGSESQEVTHIPSYMGTVWNANCINLGDLYSGLEKCKDTEITLNLVNNNRNNPHF